MGARERAAARNARAVRYGLVGVMALMLMIVFAVTARNGLPNYLPGVNPTVVKVAFRDAGALRPGDDVRIAGVRAGYVKSIDLENGVAVATVALDSGRPVYSNASAAIAARSSLGQKYIELAPGSASRPQLAADALIPVSRTTGAVELDQVLDAFDPKTRQGLATTLRNVGNGVGGRGDDLNDFLRTSPQTLNDLAAISQGLSVDNGTDLTRLLTTANDLASTFRDQTGLIAGDVRQVNATLSALDTDGGRPLGAAIDKGAPSLAATRGALRTLNRPLGALSTASVRLRPAAAALSKAVPPLRQFMRTAVVPLGKVPAVGNQASTAFGALTPAMQDLHPTAARLARTLRSTAILLTSFSPYAGEAMTFFARAVSALSEGDSAGHWLRFTPLASSQVLTGNLGVHGSARDPYPAPGQASRERSGR